MNMVELDSPQITMLVKWKLISTLEDLTPHPKYRQDVMHFLFSLLRIMGLYIFRALLAHPQEALH
jgi:hypothetical protein